MMSCKRHFNPRRSSQESLKAFWPPFCPPFPGFLSHSPIKPPHEGGRTVSQRSIFLFLIKLFIETSLCLPCLSVRDYVLSDTLGPCSNLLKQIIILLKRVFSFFYWTIFAFSKDTFRRPQQQI